jgi:hypothetical protein
MHASADKEQLSSKQVFQLPGSLWCPEILSTLDVPIADHKLSVDF